MSNYFDFVLVELEGGSKPYLFRAPAWSYFECGDLVIVDTCNGEQTATVLSSITVSADEKKEIDFIMRATRADTDVKKVLKKVEFKELVYEEDDANEQE